MIADKNKVCKEIAKENKKKNPISKIIKFFRSKKEFINNSVKY